jgi:hypothetical protein
MEKPRGLRRAAAFENPKSPIKCALDQALKGDPKVARMARKRKRCVGRSPRFAGRNGYT